MAITVDKDGIPTNRPQVTFVGIRATNVFFILGACRRAAMKEGWTTAQWALLREKFLELDRSDDQGEAAMALATRYFTVQINNAEIG